MDDLANYCLVERLPLGGAGQRVAIKDSIDVAGYRTRAGSRALAETAPAERHAEVVRLLLDADCRIVGKANMHELAYGVTGINDWTGTPLNSRFPGRVPGGSSSGSAAAVAAGIVDFAIGSDTGGSIRTPAACCAVFGLKPSFGRVSRVGAHPARSSLDCVGPLAGTMQTLEQAMAVIAPGFRSVALPDSARLGLVTVDVDAEVEGAFAAVLATLGLPCSPISLAHMDAAFDANMTIIAAETWTAFGHLLTSGMVGPDVAARLRTASEVGLDQSVRAELVRARFRDEVDAALGTCDALVLPTLPVFPPTLAEAADATASLRLTALVRQFNLSGHPALSIPVIAKNGLPMGIQLVGRVGADEQLCAIGRLVCQRINRNSLPSSQEPRI